MLREQKRTQHRLKALYDTEGGKVLVDTLLKDVLSVVDRIQAQYKRLSHEEFISAGAELNTKLNVLRSLTKAKKNEELLDELLRQ